MVDAGVSLFGKGGYTNVSLLDVVERAKAPRGSIYHHFPGGKDELATEVAASLRYQIERQAARLASKIPTAEALLRAVVEHNRKSLVASDFTEGCPMSGIIANIGGGHDEPVRAAVGQTFTGWVDALAGALVGKGLKQARARHVAMIVVVSIEGAIIMSWATRDTAAFDDVQEMLPTLLNA
jgi:AcrR family transcriptional regulator